MNHSELVDRIIKDAKKESAAILKAARKIAKSNVEYAQKQSTEIIQAARETAKKNAQRESEILKGSLDIQNRLELLKQKTKIVDEVFELAMKDIKFKFRTEDHPTYELRLTKEELSHDLRDAIENEVVAILFGDANE